MAWPSCHYGDVTGPSTMSTSTQQTGGPAFDVWQIPRLDPDQRVITGTSAGLARELGIDPVWVRMSFVVLSIAGGWGIVLYLAAWFVMTRQSLVEEEYVPLDKAVTPRVRLVAFLMIVAGVIILSVSYGVPFLGGLVWPAVFIAAAVAVGLDRSRLGRWRTLGDLPNRGVGSRVALGIALLFAGVISASFISLEFWDAVGGIVVAALVLVGAGVVFAPVIRSLGTDLSAERRMRIRSEERADMAAHLHDSVLQTLTLIQKKSSDTSVVSLARRQERELRSWLFDDKALNPNLGFRAGLEVAMASVEDDYQLPVEVVVVGDCPTNADIVALLNAAREAAANAARHSGASRVDVFAEVGPDAIEVFVRDTGVGFDIDEVGDDRAGVRNSIIGRMERHGGSARVHSSPGAGTEIELQVPRTDTTTFEKVESP